MRIEDQVCTIKQSRTLKELGISQDCESFAFVADDPAKTPELVFASGYNWSDYPGYAGWPFITRAFTVAELGIMLGDGHPSWRFQHPGTGEKLFICTRIGPNDPNVEFTHKRAELLPMNTYSSFDRYNATEAESRADLLIACLRVGVPGFTVSDVNERLKNA